MEIDISSPKYGQKFWYIFHFFPYSEVHGVNKEFVPGQTRVNYGGRYFDAEEMVNEIWK